MQKTDYTNLFNDERLSLRGHNLLSSLFKVPTKSIQLLSATRAEQKAYYRFLNNKKVDEALLSEELGVRCAKAVKDRVVLCIQDTTEINLARHINRLKPGSGVGSIDAVKKGIGFKIHPCLVVDAATSFPYGYAGIDVYNRTGLQKMPYNKLRKLPIESKESGKWIRGNQRVGQYLQEAKSVIIIQDREGDIYEQFTEEALPQNAHLLIRCKYNRYLSDNERLWTVLSGKEIAGTYRTIIEADSHKKTSRREALMEVRVAKIKFRCPEKKVKGTVAFSREVYAIEAKEITENIKDPIHWRLLTTWAVEDFGAAQQIIEWYTCRWMIEEVFKVLKKECYNIEGSELEQGWAIRKLSIMMLDTIIKVFQMLIAYNAEEGSEPINSDTAFEHEEIKCLEIINKKMQGKTVKQSNLYSINNLKGAVWTIARIGGWKGYSSQRKPGATTLINGLQKFYNYFEGYNLEKDVGTR
jgi:hypothetical protein